MHVLRYKTYVYLKLIFLFKFKVDYGHTLFIVIERIR